MSVAEVNGTTLWYEVEGDGPPVVLLHHGIADSRVWEPQRPAFAAAHRTLRYDARGFGQSPMPGGPFSAVDDLFALLDVAGMPRAALVGASMSGDVELEAAVVAPERVVALVIAPPGMMGREPSAEVQEYGAAEDAAVDGGDLEEAVRVNLDFWVAGPGRPLDEVDPEVQDRMAAMVRRSFDVQVPAYEGDPPPEAVKRVKPLVDHLPEVEAPTLVLVGEHDAVDIHEAAKVLESELRNVRVATIAGAGHVPNLERPAEFNELVLGFLAEVGAA